MILLTSLLVPLERKDVGELLPVELVYLYRDEDQIVIETDTKDLGRGMTVSQAFKDLEDTTTGVIFLDTADYLLVSETALDLTEELSEYLKPSVRVCLAGGGIDTAEAAAYLSVHHPQWRLKDLDKAPAMEKLSVRNGRFILFEKSENNA